MSTISDYYLVTDFANVKVSAETLRIVDGICPKWRTQLHHKRFRNKQVKAAREFMSELHKRATEANRALFIQGLPPMEVV